MGAEAGVGVPKSGTGAASRGILVDVDADADAGEVVEEDASAGSERLQKPILFL
jgi:hypothetical protein